MPGQTNSAYFLWERFKNGDNDAFYSIYDQYFDSLYNYGLHFTPDENLIKDCIHDLFLDLYKYRKRLSKTDNILYYLLRSLRRLIHKELTKRNMLLTDEQLMFQNDTPVMAIEDVIIADEIQKEHFKALTDVMKSLSKRQQEGLSLKFEHNLSYTEIATTLDISVESARTIIYRALKDLRKALKKNQTFNSLLLFFVFKNLIHTHKI
ncbi:sigma-70 family RNA polymerase sigma factor [Maribellus sp. CM-23]|uniref:RNA polymerase sigma factor n=1 Tax=Maribellus sp. CM-23 TaxID=2781026 RepID=UPI001F24E62C|nr:sigma-70 family RNA polymerase sigma factor [Maribellus sp. CM-23]MCE4563469.1 sigma-70 family RNA polymerase sigma factor [Maribellus sp. CM-23]